MRSSLELTDGCVATTKSMGGPALVVRLEPYNYPMLRLWGSCEDSPIMDNVGFRGDSRSSRVYPCAPVLHINSRKESNMRSHSPPYQLLRPKIASQLVHLILFNVRTSHGVGRIARTLTKDGNLATSNT